MEKDSVKEKKKRITSQSLKRAVRIFKYIKPYRLQFTIGMLFLFGTGGTALVFPMLMGNMISAASESFTENINKIALVLLVVFIAQAVFSYFRIYLFAYVTENAMAAIRVDTYSHLIKLPMSFFSSRRVGELNSRISADISLLQSTFSTTIAEFIRQIIIIIGGIFFILFISVKLTLFMLALIPIVAVAAVFFGKYIRKLSKQAQNKVAESNTVVEETFQGIANVKAFTNEKFEVNRYSQAVKEVVGVSLKSARWRGAFASFIILCSFGAIVAVVWYGTLLVQEQPDFDEGKLISFVLYTVFMGASIAGIADLYSTIQKAIGATENLLDLMDEQAEKLDFEHREVPTKLTGKVDFKNVSFEYPSRKGMTVLKNISFSVTPGEQVAIVGESGAGKSTLTSLLMRFYSPTSGKILIDDKLASNYELTEFRKQLAVVPQEVLLFGGTIGENILYGKPNATDEEIVAAAEKANAKEFIESFPEKYNTIVGERGVQLSGGQRQRIAIARAVLKNPAILILDEATSSLDSESERLVQSALDELMKGRTSFVIAHRLATVRNASKILVLSNGEVVETGTHEELLGIDKGVYKHLSSLQFDF